MMATSEALTKYYDCLKDSFNKIQVKDNKVALVNAALRPKIRDEFVKSKDVLASYLNYIQVFSLIYGDKFTNICMSIVCPLFKENAPSRLKDHLKDLTLEPIGDQDIADKFHQTIRDIVRTKPELSEEYIHCVTKYSPSVYTETPATFMTYLCNCLEICTYVKDEPLVCLVTKILDRINPPKNVEEIDTKVLECVAVTIQNSYELVFEYIDSLDEKHCMDVADAILTSYTKEFLGPENDDQMNYLLLYLCSKNLKFVDFLLDPLWDAVIDSDRSNEERCFALCFISTFMSRAKYIDLDRVFDYLEKAHKFCHKTAENLGDCKQLTSSDETAKLFYTAFQSILYLVGQRYREIYEEESIDKLRGLDLKKLIDGPAKPTNICDTSIVQRFVEVGSLYRLMDFDSIHLRKKRKSIADSTLIVPWATLFKDSATTTMNRVKPLYRSYYDHRNFTVYRE